MQRRAVVFVLVALMGVVPAACSGSSATPSTETVGLPVPTDPPDLLPVEDVTLPPDDLGTVPPGTLFHGDVCTALTASDFAGTLLDTQALSVDSCGYSVHTNAHDHVVLVQAQMQADFDQPPTTAKLDTIQGVGLGAVGIEQGAEYEVIVKVANGYFSVTAWDRAEARSLAIAAARRAGG